MMISSFYLTLSDECLHIHHRIVAWNTTCKMPNLVDHQQGSHEVKGEAMNMLGISLDPLFVSLCGCKMNKGCNLCVN